MSMGYPTLGSAAHGTFPLAGFTIAEAALPVVNVISPGASVISGPTLIISWGFTESQGWPQTSASVTVYDTSASVTLFSTTVEDAQSVAFNMLTAGLQPESVGERYTATVTATCGPPTLTSSASVGFDTLLGIPTATVINPAIGQEFTGPTLPVEWSYSDTRNWAQIAYILYLKDPQGVTVTTSSWVLSSGKESALVYQPQSEGYTLTVGVENQNGVKAYTNVPLVGAGPAGSGTPGGQYQPSPTSFRIYDRLPQYMVTADQAQGGE